MRCWSSSSSTTMRPMLGSFMGSSGRLDTHPEVSKGARGYPHAVVDTVTDDPERRVGRQCRVGAGTHDRAGRAARGRNARLDERVAHELRATATEGPEPLANECRAHR